MRHRKVFAYLLVSMFLVLQTITVGTPVNPSINATTTVALSPSKIIGSPDVGGYFKLYLNVENVVDLYLYSVALKWNPTVLNCVNFTFNYTFMPSGGIAISGKINNTAGKIYPTFGYSLTTESGVTGSGTIAQAWFQVKASGESSIDVLMQSFLNSFGGLIPFDTVNCSFKLIPPHGPTANFNYTPSEPQVGGSVKFNASASLPGWNGTANVPIATYKWNFGDEKNGTGMIINHTYTAANTYTVTLTVTCVNDPVLTAKGLTTNSTSQPITVYAAPKAPKAKFTYSPPSPRVNSKITFDASTSEQGYNGTHNVPIANYTWNFGDDNTTTVTTPIIYHKYTTAKNYTVNLNVTCQDDPVLIDKGLTSDTTSQTVTVSPPPPPHSPTAVKTHMPSTPRTGDTVTFDASSSLAGFNGTAEVPIANYTWNFGDDNTTTVTVPIIYHAYTSTGTYTVNLTVTCIDDSVLIGLGLTSNSTWQPITVLSSLVPPVARFTYSPSYPLAGDTVTFDASTSTPDGGTIVSYRWDFGDGNTTTVATSIIHHAYASKGNYTVALKVTDSQGLWNTTSKKITIAAPKHPMIHPAEGQYANYLIYYFKDDEIYSTRGWNFTYVQYISPDLINVTLWIRDPVGTDPTVWMVVNIMDRKVVSGAWMGTWFIGWIQTNITLGSTIKLDDGTATVVGSQIINFKGYAVDCWELLQDPTGYTYLYDKFSGLWFGIMQYESLLYVVNITLVDTNIHFGVHPTASFTYSPISPFINEPVAFDASASYDPDGTIASYTWDFGDGNVTTVSDSVVYHRYAEVDDYNVTLTVTDNDGLTAVATGTVTVTRTELNVVVDVGSIHFRGEMAEFYVLISCFGKPVNATLSARLYYGGALHADLSSSVEYVATGLYRVPYTIPSGASAGTYMLVVEAKYFSLSGTSMKGFLVSGWMYAWLMNIQGDVATIKTDIATFQISLDGINVKLQSIEGKVVTIETDLGTIKVDADLINATVTAINGRIAKIETNLGDIEVSVFDINATISAFEGKFVTIETDLGTIKINITDINLTVKSINGTTVMLSTDLGDIEGRLESIEGDVVTIKTDLGTVLVDIADVKDKLPTTTPTTTLGISVGSILSAIAAIFAIAAVVLLLRKRKSPTL